jgi:hypothetical protein
MNKSSATLMLLSAVLVAGCATTKSGTGVAAGGPGSATHSAADSSVPAMTETPTLAALPDPCSLLTQAEAETLATIKLNKPVSAGADGTKTLCQWTAPPTGPVAQVEVLVGDGVAKALSIDKDELHHKFTTVPGIGDQCLLEDGNIFIKKGTNAVQINLVLLDEPGNQAQRLEAAAKAIVARLP